jgi:hypothetical protein
VAGWLALDDAALTVVAERWTLGDEVTHDARDSRGVYHSDGVLTERSAAAPPRAGGRALPTPPGAPRRVSPAARNLKFTGLTQNLGQLQGSYRDFQSNCWVNLRILGQPCEFYLRVKHVSRAVVHFE